MFLEHRLLDYAKDCLTAFPERCKSGKGFFSLAQDVALIRLHAALMCHVYRDALCIDSETGQIVTKNNQMHSVSCFICRSQTCCSRNQSKLHSSGKLTRQHEKRPMQQNYPTQVVSWAALLHMHMWEYQSRNPRLAADIDS